MNKHIVEKISLYLDDELQEWERLAVEIHTKTCADCRAALQAEGELVTAIRNARPSYRAPASLQARVAELVRRPRSFRECFSSRAMVAACAILLVAASAYWMAFRTSVDEAPTSFVAMAVNHHVRYLNGQLPLDMLSDSPEEISTWFAGKLNFDLKLPDYPQRPPDPKPYHAEGARLVGFRDDFAAYVMYRLNGHPISLLVTSDAAAVPSGGEETLWEGLRFHFQTLSGWKVLTWSDRGLTYALVSNLEERGQASCIVCHQDERVFRGLNSPKKGM